MHLAHSPLKSVHRFYSASLIVLLGWLLCPPVGAVYTVLEISSLKKLLRSSAYFWAPSLAIFIGMLWGTSFAIVVPLLGHLAFTALWKRICFAVFGLFCIAYLGLGNGQNRMLVSQEDENMVIAETMGLICYIPLVALELWLF